VKETNFTYNNTVTNFLINPSSRIYRHLLLILCIAIVATNAALLSFPYDYNIAFGYSLGLLTIYLGIAYFNLYLLVPRYLLQNRYWAYMGILMVLVLFSIIIDLLIEFHIKKHFHFDLLNLIATCFLYVICFAGTSIGMLFKHWLTSGQQINELEKTTIQTELQRLKSQIHPDFLFGTLEKAGELATQTPEKTSNILLKLSKFLRYQLYDSTRNEVMLSSEIASLENLLNLEKEQHNGFTYSIKIDGDTKQLFVPPLLFISLVLPVIKNIKEEEKNPFVHLSFNIKEDLVIFTCMGTKPDKSTGFKDTSNIKRRLELLFAGNYTLDFSEEEVSQTIYLCLNLS
jgi:hypothetical protein